MKASKTIFLLTFIILLLCFYLTPLVNAGQDKGWYRFIGPKEKPYSSPTIQPKVIPPKEALPEATPPEATPPKVTPPKVVPPVTITPPIVTGKTHAGRDPIVDVFFNSLDAIISYGPGPEQAQGDYPVEALVTLVVTETDPDTGKKILFRYLPGSPPVEITCSVAPSVITEIRDVTQSVLPNINLAETLDVPASGRPSWKGVFYSWDTVTTKAPSILDAPRSFSAPLTIIIRVTGLSPIIILSVRSWNYSSSHPKTSLKVSAKLNNKPIRVFPMQIPLPSDVDTVDFVRENCPEGQEATFQGDPGRFVVKGADEPFTGRKRTYDEIGQILSNAMKRKISLGGGGPDWLQVAAAHAYNNSRSSLSACVRKIVATNMGSTGEGGQGIVWLNPYDLAIRLNCSFRDGYSFVWLYGRDSLIRHEAFHNYHHKPGLGWLTSDNDQDGLTVEKKGRLSIHFSEDIPGRGFISLAGSHSVDYVGLFLNGKGGDSYKNDILSHRFLEDLSRSGISRQIIEGESATFDSHVIPSDFPYEKTEIVLGPDLFSYNLALHKPYYWDPHDSAEVPIELIKFSAENFIRKRTEFGGNGYYDRRLARFDIGDFSKSPGFSKRILNELKQLDKQGYTLFLGLMIRSDKDPQEYDASSYGLGGSFE